MKGRQDGERLPVLVGNFIGGTALFSLLACGQVREEIDWPRKCPDYPPEGCEAGPGVIGEGNGKQHE